MLPRPNTPEQWERFADVLLEQTDATNEAMNALMDEIRRNREELRKSLDEGVRLMQILSQLAGQVRELKETQGEIFGEWA